jgi:hypothetical protein
MTARPHSNAFFQTSFHIENFDIAEEEKRKQQIEAFVKRSQPKSMHSSFVERFNAYRFFKGKPKAISVNLPPQLVLPLKKSIVRDFYVAEEDVSLVEPFWMDRLPDFVRFVSTSALQAHPISVRNDRHGGSAVLYSSHAQK